MESLKNKIEAIIFISDTPVKSKEIADFLGENEVLIRESINELIAAWNEMDSSINIEEIAGGFQFRTKDTFKDLLTEYINKKPYRLSRAGLEVLGIIAKKQPVTKIEIDKIRGVDSVGAINVLIERELIKVDLPEPIFPNIPRVSPDFKLKLILSRALIPFSGY